MKTIGIVGSRTRNSLPDFTAVKNVFDKLYDYGDRVVSGGCPQGGDAFAEEIAKRRGLTITIHYPDWVEGKQAGFLRNTKIAEDCDVLIACLDPTNGRGTQDTIDRVRKLDKPVVIV